MRDRALFKIGTAGLAGAVFGRSHHSDHVAVDLIRDGIAARSTRASERRCV